MIDLSMIHQVVMNLCTNAYQAMQNAPSGILSVDLEEIVIDDQNTARYHHLTPRTYIRIRVSDNGCGIEPDLCDKIFDPYFTTKPKDKGTGLGLSISYGIVKNAGGLIAADSQPGEGSRFEVFLPVSETAGGQALSDHYDGPLPCGNERILLVDDEKPVIDFEKQLLEKLGYYVTPLTDSEEAFEAFSKQPHAYDLLLADQTMPKICGMELVRKIRQIRPEMPVMLCTGYNEKLIHEQIQEAGIQALLIKPMTGRDLAITLRQILDAKVKVG